MEASKLTRSAPRTDVWVGPPVASNEHGLAELIGDLFEPALEAGEWWGAQIVGGQEEAAEILRALGDCGCRCATVAGRVGLAGFLMALAHPEDAKGWPAVSTSSGLAKRPLGPGAVEFKRQTLVDFGHQPAFLESNEERAKAAKLSQEMSAMLGQAASRSEGRRL